MSKADRLEGKGMKEEKTSVSPSGSQIEVLQILHLLET